ncbi:ATP-binding protein [Streptomyces sp. NPDC052701]|uniref:ATP-binding protein n=1 Tax=Streptomyces sp. NPDC052701 TaxID=3155533 RepID=UPI003428E734
MAAHRLVLSVPAATSAVTAARHQAVDGIRGWDAGLDHDVVHTAALVISELLTNAVRHAGAGRILLSVRLTGIVLRIEVCDSSSSLPRPGLPDDDSESGRGLLLVSALADRHGVRPTAAGKRCWAEIFLSTPSTTESPVSLPLLKN